MEDAQTKSIHRRDYSILLDMLIELRQKKNMTQVELAKRIGKDQTYLSKIERGIRRVDVVELRSILSALGKDFVSFVREFEKALSMK
ncbi:helix-turn-helix transcriptional regulator [bacterium]|nr:helix-turn-helix transcriptional regulator [bacterium]